MKPRQDNSIFAQIADHIRKGDYVAVQVILIKANKIPPGFNINRLPAKTEPPLISAVRSSPTPGSRFQLVYTLLEFGSANIHKIDAENRNVLHWAVIHDDLEVVYSLIEEIERAPGKNPAPISFFDAVDIYGKTPLEYAIELKRTNIQVVLLEARGEYPLPTALLIKAIWEGEFPLVMACSAPNAFKDFKEASGRTLLHEAILSPNLSPEIVRVLVLSGLSWDTKDHTGISPRNLLENLPSTEIVDALIAWIL